MNQKAIIKRKSFQDFLKNLSKQKRLDEFETAVLVDRDSLNICETR